MILTKPRQSCRRRSSSECTHVVVAYIVMAYTAMVYVVIGCAVMAYTVTAHIDTFAEM